MDAGAMVQLARNWIRLPEQRKCVMHLDTSSGYVHVFLVVALIAQQNLFKFNLTLVCWFSRYPFTELVKFHTRNRWMHNSFTSVLRLV